MSIDISKMPPEKTPGYGFIRIDWYHFRELFNDLDIKNTDLQGKLHDDGVMETLHKRLLLPESYKVLAIYFDYQRRIWQVLVESHDLPVVDQGSIPPEIVPMMRKDERGITTLAGIKVL